MKKNLGNNRTKEFFAKHPKYVSIIEVALTGRELEIIKGRLYDINLQDIGLEMELSSERVRQLEQIGLKKIKEFISKI